MKRFDLDPALHGIAPVERDVHGGTVYLTMQGLMRKLGLSRASIYRAPGLMALRRTITPGTARWLEHEVDAYIAALPTAGAQPKLVGRARLRQMSRTAQAVVEHDQPTSRQITTARQRIRNLREMLRGQLQSHREGTPHDL